MDKIKFNNRIIKMAKAGLKDQGLLNKIDPKEVINEQEKLYLLRCSIKGRKGFIVFIRNNDKCYYLYGIKKLPEERNIRHYIGVIRKPKEENQQPSPIIERERNI